MVGGRWVFLLALLEGASVALSSVANVFEDGLHMEASAICCVLS